MMDIVSAATWQDLQALHQQLPPLASYQVAMAMQLQRLAPNARAPEVAPLQVFVKDLQLSLVPNLPALPLKLLVRLAQSLAKFAPRAAAPAAAAAAGAAPERDAFAAALASAAGGGAADLQQQELHALLGDLTSLGALAHATPEAVLQLAAAAADLDDPLATASGAALSKAIQHLCAHGFSAVQFLQAGELVGGRLHVPVDPMFWTLFDVFSRIRVDARPAIERPPLDQAFNALLAGRRMPPSDQTQAAAAAAQAAAVAPVAAVTAAAPVFVEEEYAYDEDEEEHLRNGPPSLAAVPLPFVPLQAPFASRPEGAATLPDAPPPSAAAAASPSHPPDSSNAAPRASATAAPQPEPSTSRQSAPPPAAAAATPAPTAAAAAPPPAAASAAAVTQASPWADDTSASSPTPGGPIAAVAEWDMDWELRPREGAAAAGLRRDRNSLTLEADIVDSAPSAGGADADDLRGGDQHSSSSGSSGGTAASSGRPAPPVARSTVQPSSIILTSVVNAMALLEGRACLPGASADAALVVADPSDVQACLNQLQPLLDVTTAAAPRPAAYDAGRSGPPSATQLLSLVRLVLRATTPAVASSTSAAPSTVAPSITPDLIACLFDRLHLVGWPFSASRTVATAAADAAAALQLAAAHSYPASAKLVDELCTRACGAKLADPLAAAAAVAALTALNGKPSGRDIQRVAQALAQLTEKDKTASSAATPAAAGAALAFLGACLAGGKVLSPAQCAGVLRLVTPQWRDLSAPQVEVLLACLARYTPATGAADPTAQQLAEALAYGLESLPMSEVTRLGESLVLLGVQPTSAWMAAYCRALAAGLAAAGPATAAPLTPAAAGPAGASDLVKSLRFVRRAQHYAGPTLLGALCAGPLSGRSLPSLPLSDSLELLEFVVVQLGGAPVSRNLAQQVAPGLLAKLADPAASSGGGLSALTALPPTQAARALWACARLRARPEQPQLQASLSALEPHLGALDAPALTRVLWACAQFQVAPHTKFVARVLEASADELPRCSAATLALLPECLARLGIAPGAEWRGAWLVAAAALLPTADAETVSMFGQGVLQLGTEPPASWMAAFWSAASSTAEAADLASVVRVLHFMAATKTKPDTALMTALFDRSFDQLFAADPAALLPVLLRAVAALGWVPPATWMDELCYSLTDMAAQLKPPALCVVALGALATLKHEPGADCFQALVGAAHAGRADMGVLELRWLLSQADGSYQQYDMSAVQQRELLAASESKAKVAAQGEPGEPVAGRLGEYVSRTWLAAALGEA